MGETPDLLIVGSVAFDTIETPRARAEHLLGGAATYAALAAAKWEIRPAVVGVVGEDFGEDEFAILHSAGIDTTSLERRAGETFRWSGRYLDDLNERETLTTELGVFAEFSPRVPEEQRGAPFVFLANIDPEIQLSLLEQLERPRLIAADSMNLWLNTKREAVLEVFSRADLVLVNEDEAALLKPGAGLRVVGEYLLSCGPDYAVVKRGEHGAVLVAREGMFLCPAYPVLQVADPTGAGDTFAGGLMGYLAATGEVSMEHLRRAIGLGTVAASFCVEEFGVGGIREATLAELCARYEELRQMMDLPPLEG